jgi:Asp/Glu/hydantoin racemase
VSDPRVLEDFLRAAVKARLAADSVDVVMIGCADLGTHGQFDHAGPDALRVATAKT